MLWAAVEGWLSSRLCSFFARGQRTAKSFPTPCYFTPGSKRGCESGPCRAAVTKAEEYLEGWMDFLAFTTRNLSGCSLQVVAPVWGEGPSPKRHTCPSENMSWAWLPDVFPRPAFSGPALGHRRLLKCVLYFSCLNGQQPLGEHIRLPD